MDWTPAPDVVGVKCSFRRNQFGWECLVNDDFTRYAAGIGETPSEAMHNAISRANRKGIEVDTADAYRTLTRTLNKERLAA